MMKDYKYPIKKSGSKELVNHDWKNGLLGLAATAIVAVGVYFGDHLQEFGLGKYAVVITPVLMFTLDMVRRYLKDNTKE